MTTTDSTSAGALVPLVSQAEIGDIAIKVDADNGYMAHTGDTLVIGMMVAAMWLLQRRYEAERIASLTEAADDAVIPASVREAIEEVTAYLVKHHATNEVTRRFGLGKWATTIDAWLREQGGGADGAA